MQCTMVAPEVEAGIDVTGVLPIDKPPDLTSHDVVARVRRRLNIRKVGHTGTLDPLATRVLVLCLGRATRLSSYLASHDKTYSAHIRLGIRTSTLDAEGEVVARCDRVPTDVSVVRSAVGSFVGDIEQIPPMFSARKVDGRRLYQLARAGADVARRPSRVRIFRIDIEDFSPPELHLTVSCSKGTYIRTLADDIGSELGCGAYLAGLRRTSAGPVRLDECVTLSRLDSVASREELRPYLLDPNRLLRDLPRLNLNAAQAGCFIHGNAVANVKDGTALESGQLARALHPEGVLLGIGRWKADDGILKPVRVLCRPKG